MKLQRQVSRVVGKTEYAKWVITVPPQHISELGWKEGEQLESHVNSNTLLVKRETNPRPNKMTYEEFKEKVGNLLRSVPKGLTWTEIKARLKLPQKVPNNLWVRLMERDVGLVRKFNSQTGKTLWRLK